MEVTETVIAVVGKQSLLNHKQGLDHEEPAQTHPVPAPLIDGFLAQTGLSLEPEPP